MSSCVEYGMWGGGAGHDRATHWLVQALLDQYLQLLCVCTVTMDYTTKDLRV